MSSRLKSCRCRVEDANTLGLSIPVLHVRSNSEYSKFTSEGRGKAVQTAGITIQEDAKIGAISAFLVASDGRLLTLAWERKRLKSANKCYLSLSTCTGYFSKLSYH